ncbi:MAG: signal transduction histidine kinase, partial [Porticoccaceae bacterium]
QPLKASSIHRQPERKEAKRRMERSVPRRSTANSAVKLRAPSGLGQLGKDLPDEQKAFLNSTAELVHQTIDSTRNLMVELSPAPLYELGFWPAVDRLANQVTAQSDIEVVCENLSPEVSVNLDSATVLFRIVRELLHNCVKHSETKQAVVRQFVEDDQLGPAHDA